MARLSYIVTIIGIALVCVFAEELYSDKYDEDYTATGLDDDPMRDQYINCFLETSPCETDGMKYFKEIFGEAVLTDCKKCTEKQKSSMIITKEWFTKNKPEQWEIIVAKSKEDMEKKNAGK